MSQNVPPVIAAQAAAVETARRAAIDAIDHAAAGMCYSERAAYLARLAEIPYELAGITRCVYRDMLRERRQRRDAARARRRRQAPA